MLFPRWGGEEKNEEWTMDNEEFVTIYGVRQRGSTHIRYVGSTTKKLSVRISAHLTQPQEFAFQKWAKALIASGGKIDVIPLAKLYGPRSETLRSAAIAAEKHYIQSLASRYSIENLPPLLNIVSHES